MTYIFGDLGRSWSFLGIWGAKANTFREPRQLLSGIWGDQCIIFRDQGSTDPPGGPHKSLELSYNYHAPVGGNG